MWKKELKSSAYSPRDYLCQHDGNAECQCPVPHEERRASSFYRSYCRNGCYRFFQDNGKAFFNLELVKTLILYNEMDTIFRVCAYSGMDLRSWWRVARCSCEVRMASPTSADERV
jgi:hypothetical protein